MVSNFQLRISMEKQKKIIDLISRDKTIKGSRKGKSVRPSVSSSIRFPIRPFALLRVTLSVRPSIRASVSGDLLSFHTSVCHSDTCPKCTNKRREIHFNVPTTRASAAEKPENCQKCEKSKSISLEIPHGVVKESKRKQKK